ncbi:MAG: hypothetical protein ACE5GK_09575 [Nitrospiria bacterium]
MIENKLQDKKRDAGPFHSHPEKNELSETIELQLNLLGNTRGVSRHINSVTYALSDFEEAWHLFEDLSHLVWKKIGRK